VSDAFQQLTGFNRQEIVGRNCRFLNQGALVNTFDNARLKIACKTGAPFVTLLPNRKKNGQLFVNLLDLRGLAVGKSAKSGEPLWYLVGIQADVTDVEVLPDQQHVAVLNDVLSRICDCLRLELSRKARRAAADPAAHINGSSDKRVYELLEAPHWMTGDEHGPNSKMKGTMSLEALSWRHHNLAPGADKDRVQKFIESYERETVALLRGETLARRWFFIDEWKKRLRDHSSIRYLFMGFGLAAFVFGFTASAGGRDSRRYGRSSPKTATVLFKGSK
jgi:hypothetical protein